MDDIDPGDVPSRLIGVAAKIQRAREHVGVLHNVADDWRKQTTEPVVQIHRDGDWEVATALPPFVPPQIPVIFGEVVHNLRSALDHLVYQLVSVLGYKPAGHNYFPIAYESAVFEGLIKRRRDSQGRLRKGALDPIPPDHQAVQIIRGHQPYNRWNPDLPYRPDAEWLAALHRLWNIDKHRLLIKATLALPETEQAVLDLFQWDPNVGLIEHKVNMTVLNRSLEDETEFARFRFDDTTQLHLDMKSGFPGDVRLHCADDGRTGIRFGTLVPHHLVNRVHTVFEDLTRFF